MISISGGKGAGEQVKRPEEAGNNRRAVLFVFRASVCFSTGGLFIKMIPWSALAINGARNLIGAAMIGIYLILSRHRLVFSRQVFVGALLGILIALILYWVGLK